MYNICTVSQPNCTQWSLCHKLLHYYMIIKYTLKAFIAEDAKPQNLFIIWSCGFIYRPRDLLSCMRNPIVVVSTWVYWYEGMWKWVCWVLWNCDLYVLIVTTIRYFVLPAVWKLCSHSYCTSWLDQFWVSSVVHFTHKLQFSTIFRLDGLSGFSKCWTNETHTTFSALRCSQE